MILKNKQKKKKTLIVASIFLHVKQVELICFWWNENDVATLKNTYKLNFTFII